MILMSNFGNGRRSSCWYLMTRHLELERRRHEQADMHVIVRKRLNEFAVLYPDTKNALVQ